MSRNVPIIESKLVTKLDGCQCCNASLSAPWSDDLAGEWNQVKQLTVFRLGRGTADGKHARTVAQTLCDKCLLAYAEVVKLAAKEAQNRIKGKDNDERRDPCKYCGADAVDAAGRCTECSHRVGFCLDCLERLDADGNCQTIQCISSIKNQTVPRCPHCDQHMGDGEHDCVCPECGHDVDSGFCVHCDYQVPS